MNLRMLREQLSTTLTRGLTLSSHVMADQYLCCKARWEACKVHHVTADPSCSLLQSENLTSITALCSGICVSACSKDTVLSPTLLDLTKFISCHAMLSRVDLAAVFTSFYLVMSSFAIAWDTARRSLCLGFGTQHWLAVWFNCVCEICSPSTIHGWFATIQSRNPCCKRTKIYSFLLKVQVEASIGYGKV